MMTANNEPNDEDEEESKHPTNVKIRGGFSRELTLSTSRSDILSTGTLGRSLRDRSMKVRFRGTLFQALDISTLGGSSAEG